MWYSIVITNCESDMAVSAFNCNPITVVFYDMAGWLGGTWTTLRWWACMHPQKMEGKKRVNNWLVGIQRSTIHSQFSIWICSYERLLVMLMLSMWMSPNIHNWRKSHLPTTTSLADHTDKDAMWQGRGHLYQHRKLTGMAMCLLSSDLNCQSVKVGRSS